MKHTSNRPPGLLLGLICAAFLLAGALWFTSSGNNDDGDPVAADVTASSAPTVDQPDISTVITPPSTQPDVIGFDGTAAATSTTTTVYEINTDYTPIGADCDTALDPARVYIAKLGTSTFTAQDAVDLQAASDAAVAVCTSDEWLTFQITELQPVLDKLGLDQFDNDPTDDTVATLDTVPAASVQQ
jgi:hypothetical protein